MINRIDWLLGAADHEAAHQRGLKAAEPAERPAR